MNTLQVVGGSWSLICPFVEVNHLRQCQRSEAAWRGLMAPCTGLSVFLPHDRAVSRPKLAHGGQLLRRELFACSFCSYRNNSLDHIRQGMQFHQRNVPLQRTVLSLELIAQRAICICISLRRCNDRR